MDLWNSGASDAIEVTHERVLGLWNSGAFESSTKAGNSQASSVLEQSLANDVLNSWALGIAEVGTGSSSSSSSSPTPDARQRKSHEQRESVPINVANMFSQSELRSSSTGKPSPRRSEE